MPRLIWLPEAVHDLGRLREFIDGKSPAAARRSSQRILQAAELLQHHPQAGRPLDDLADFRDLLIPFGARGYVLRYRITSSAVVVVRVWHARELRPAGR